jgi:hypothetical protein
MGRNLLVVLVLAVSAQAAIWPEQLGQAKRVSVKPVTPPDQKLWAEYGFQESEEAGYDLQGKTFMASAIRLLDSTGAMAAFQWQRPESAKRSALTSLAVEVTSGVLLAKGNYLLRFEGYTPQAADLDGLYPRLPRLEQSQLPSVSNYLPKENLAANSERYILGPVSLEKFEPRIPPSVAGFHFGAEAQQAIYKAPGSDLKITLFSYPTPAIARERLAEFQKLSGAMASRSGPLVAILIAPGNADEAEKLLAQVRYQVQITWSERVPTRRDNIGDLMMNIFSLTGILLAFALVAGLAVGGLRAAFRRGGSQEQEAMITLHLDR